MYVYMYSSHHQGCKPSDTSSISLCINIASFPEGGPVFLGKFHGGSVQLTIATLHAVHTCLNCNVMLFVKSFLIPIFIALHGISCRECV